MNAFSKGDINGMLDCIEPDSAALIEGATGIAASQFGLDAATLMGMSPGLMSIMNAYGYGYSVDYTIVGETVHGDTATVTVDFELSADGETMMSDENAEVALVKTDGRWYIALS